MNELSDNYVFHIALHNGSGTFQSARLGDWIVILVLVFASSFYLGDGKLWGKPDPDAYLWYQAPQRTGDFKVKQKQTRNIDEKLQQAKCDIAILFGSQSGVSEALAERLARDWQSRFALRSLVADLDDYDASSLSKVPAETPCVFLCSTYGEGDPPDNAINFCSALEKMRKRGTRLDALRYLALGMGNKNYKRYNQTIGVSTLHGVRCAPI